MQTVPALVENGQQLTLLSPHLGMAALAGPLAGAPGFPCIPSERACAVLPGETGGWRLQSLAACDASDGHRNGAPDGSAWGALQLPAVVAALHEAGLYALAATPLTPLAPAASAGAGEQPGASGGAETGADLSGPLGWRLEVRSRFARPSLHEGSALPPSGPEFAYILCSWLSHEKASTQALLAYMSAHFAHGCGTGAGCRGRRSAGATGRKARSGGRQCIHEAVAGPGSTVTAAQWRQHGFHMKGMQPWLPWRSRLHGSRHAFRVPVSSS